MKNFLQNYWEMPCKNIESYSAKILILGLQTHWEVLPKNTDTCFAEMLRGGLQNNWKVFCKITKESSKLWQKNEQLLSKNSGTWSFSATSWLRDFEMLKDKKHLLREKPFEKLWYRLVHKKGDTADEWSYDS